MIRYFGIDLLEALLPGDEFDVIIYDGRSTADPGTTLADSDHIGLAGPMPASAPAGLLMLFFVVAQDKEGIEVGRNFNGIWRAFDVSDVPHGVEHGTVFLVNDDDLMVQAIPSTPDAELTHTDYYYDPDPVLIPTTTGGTWYLYTGKGEPSTIHWFSASMDDVCAM